MPNIAEQTTKYLLENMLESTSDFTPEEIKAELLNERLVPEDHEIVEMRGGLFPTRPGL